MMYKNKEAVMKWREKNKEKYREIKKECQKRYYEKNKEVLNKEKAEWNRNRTQRIKNLEEENRKLKLHIEAKDKAYTALLKDYEEIKEKNKNMKEKLEKQL